MFQAGLKPKALELEECTTQLTKWTLFFKLLNMLIWVQLTNACSLPLKGRILNDFNFLKKLFRNFMFQKNKYFNKNKMYYFEGMIVRYLYDN